MQCTGLILNLPGVNAGNESAQITPGASLPEVEPNFDERLFAFGNELNDLLHANFEVICALNVPVNLRLTMQIEQLEADKEALKTENEYPKNAPSNRVELMEIARLKAWLNEF